MKQTDGKSRQEWARFSISSLEADVAYFDARLALLNKKNPTYHQLAQVKAYTELERVLSRMLNRLKGAAQRQKGGAGVGIEVREEGGDADPSLQEPAGKPRDDNDSVDKMPVEDR